MKADDLLLTEVKGHAAFFTINNPDKKNALNDRILEKLHTQLDTFSRDNAVRCIVVKGKGGQVFSSGYDISAVPVKNESNQTPKAPDILIRAFDLLKKFPYPTIAMINGDAFGAGFNLCACCDIRIAAQGIKMAMTPARLGVAYHPEGVQQFISAFGFSRTKEIFYTARIFESSELMQKGIADYVVAESEIEQFVSDYAEKITSNAPLSLKGIKQTIILFEDRMNLTEKELEKAGKIQLRCFESRDLKEGKAAFLEKRKPEFTGE